MVTAQELLIGLEAATLVALIVYVVQTGRIASATRESNRVSEKTIEEMREARKQESQPYVVVYFDLPYGESVIELVVKNVGKLPARDVELAFSPSLKTPDDNDKLASVFSGGMKTLPPGHEIRAFFAVSHQYFKDDRRLPRRYTARLSYSGGLDGERRTEEQILDLAPYENLVYRVEKGVHHLVKVAEKIERHQRKLPKEFERLRERVSDGFWIQGMASSGGSLPASPGDWKADARGALREIEVLLEGAYTAEERQIVGIRQTRLQNRLKILGSELLKLAARAPPEDGSISENTLELAQAVLLLGEWDRILDGRGDMNGFGTRCEEVLEKTQELGARLIQLEA